MKAIKTIFSVFIVSFLLMGASITNTKRYQADMFESLWVNQKTPFICELKHTIPTYGSARFFKQSGDTLQFDLNVLHTSSSNKSGYISSVPPVWKAKLKSTEIAIVKIETGNTPIKLEYDQAMILLGELEQGMKPSLQYRDQYNSSYVVKVALSPVNFTGELLTFRECLTQLHPTSFENIQLSDIYFDDDSVEIATSFIEKFKAISSYIEKDPDIIKIIVSGYVSPTGDLCYNKDVSEFRAENTKDALIAAGIDENLIELASIKVKKEAVVEGIFTFKSDIRKQFKEKQSLQRRVSIKLIRGQLSRK